MAPFKTFGERLKGTFTTFTPTEPSARLTKTFGEVQAFKRQLLKAELQLKSHAKATEDLLRTIDETVTAFPRAWSKADDGLSASLQEEDLTKPEPGKRKLTSYPSLGFTRTLESDLKEEVFDPIAAWHSRYRNIKERISETERTRGEYNKARAKMGEAHKAALKMAAKVDSNKVEEDPAVHQADIMLTASRDEYIRIEEAVHVELLVLVMDSQNALDFVTRALTLSARTLMDSAARHQQETIKLLPLLITESSGPLSLGPPSPSSSLGSPVLMLGGASSARGFKRTDSPLGTGTPTEEEGAPAVQSPLGLPVAVASQIEEAAPEDVYHEAAAVHSPAEHEVATETTPEAYVARVVAEGQGAPHHESPTPWTEGGESHWTSKDGKAASNAPGSVDTPFGPATVNVSFDEKRVAFLQEHA